MKIITPLPSSIQPTLLLCLLDVGGFRSARGGVNTVSINPASGAIPHEDSSKCALSFLPQSRMSLVGCELLLKVSHSHYLSVPHISQWNGRKVVRPKIRPRVHIAIVFPQPSPYEYMDWSIALSPKVGEIIRNLLY